MKERSTLPADFDPWFAVDALKGLTEAIFEQVTQGAVSDSPLDPDTHSSLIGLTYAARMLARDLSTYFRTMSEAGLELPVRKDIQETGRPPYTSIN